MPGGRPPDVSTAHRAARNSASAGPGERRCCAGGWKVKAGTGAAPRILSATLEIIGLQLQWRGAPAHHRRDAITGDGHAYSRQVPKISTPRSVRSASPICRSRRPPQRRLHGTFSCAPRVTGKAEYVPHRLYSMIGPPGEQHGEFAVAVNHGTRNRGRPDASAREREGVTDGEGRHFAQLREPAP